MAITFVIPYRLIMSEVGSSFTEEGGPYEWVKLAFGRFQAGIAAVVYWASNPFWVGGSLAFIASEAWAGIDSPRPRRQRSRLVGDYAFKLLFIWFSIGVAIAAIEKGKWIPNAGAIARVLVLGFFTITLVVYAIENGVEGFAVGDMKPTLPVFLALDPADPLQLRRLRAAERRRRGDGQPTAGRAGLGAALRHHGRAPLHRSRCSGSSSCCRATRSPASAASSTRSSRRSASTAARRDVLFDLMALGFIFTLMTSGAVWMIGADRVLAVAAYDGSFFPWFGVFNKKLGTPVRCNVLSGIVSTLFMVAAVLHAQERQRRGRVLRRPCDGDLDDAPLVPLDLPGGLKLRYKEPGVHRPYRVPGSGNAAMWVLVAIVSFWALLGSWVAVFPGTLEPLFGVSYDFRDTWGVSRAAFHSLTLGTLCGHVRGRGRRVSRRQERARARRRHPDRRRRRPSRRPA